MRGPAIRPGPRRWPRHQRRAGRARTGQGPGHDRRAPDRLPLPGRSPSAAPDTRREPGRALIARFRQRRLAARTRCQPSFSGHSRTLRWAASRMSCASMPVRDSAMPNAGHSQTNSSGPAGGSGQVHHRETNECGPPPPANGYRTGPAGSESWSGLRPPGLPTALLPSENCRPNRKERRDAARSRGPPGRCSPGWSALGRIRAVRKISIPAEKADSPVTATATWSVRASSRVSTGTMPGNSASGGSHG